MESLLLPVIFLLGMYILMIRPQRRRMVQREAMLRAVGVGDEVATVGGVIGVVVAEEGDDVVALEVDTDVELRVQRRAISEVLVKVDGADESDVIDGVAESQDGPISEG